jgi:MinD-like ATPase involved in chromosome partitioning or flagellar assembly
MGTMTTNSPADSAFSFTDPPFWHTAAPSWKHVGEERDAVQKPLSVASHEPAHPDDLLPLPPPREEEAPVDDRLVKPTEPIPLPSWSRRFLNGGGLLRSGRSQAQLRDEQLVAMLIQPVQGSRTIAVMSTKGGVGKTTVTINLGHMFAGFRGDKVIALDANPDGGSLTYRIPRETRSTITDLIDDLSGVDPNVVRYSDVRRYTSQASSRLEVLASPQDPHTSRALNQEQYGQALDLLRRHFTLVLADCGTSILDPITRSVIEAADQLILVTTPSIDAARSTSFLISWLISHGHAQLVKEAVLVMNAVGRRTGPVNLMEMERHFTQRVRATVQIPWDPHLETGAQTALQDLRSETREAYLHLAVAVADDFLPPLPSEPPFRENKCCANCGR